MAADDQIGKAAATHQRMQDDRAGQDQIGPVAAKPRHILALAQRHAAQHRNHLLQARAAEAVAVDMVEPVATRFLIDLSQRADGAADPGQGGAAGFLQPLDTGEALGRSLLQRLEIARADGI